MCERGGWTACTPATSFRIRTASSSGVIQSFQGVQGTAKDISLPSDVLCNQVPYRRDAIFPEKCYVLDFSERITGGRLPGGRGRGRPARGEWLLSALGPGDRVQKWLTHPQDGSAGVSA